MYEGSVVIFDNDIVNFKEYIENDTVIKMPYAGVGMIPNYKYVIGDNELFKTVHRNEFDAHRCCYKINVHIPFTMN